MSPDVLLISFPSIVWAVLSVIVFLVCLLLILVILMQDSKDTGLASTFGGGGGGSALLGARMQKDLANFTVILSIVLGVSLLLMGFLTTYMERTQSFGDTAKLPASEAPAGAEAPEAPPEKTPGSDAGSPLSPEAKPGAKEEGTAPGASEQPPAPPPPVDGPAGQGSEKEPSGGLEVPAEPRSP